MTIKIAHGITYSVIENVNKIMDIGDYVRIIPPYEEELILTNITPMTKDVSHQLYIDITKNFIKEAKLFNLVFTLEVDNE